MHPLFSLNLIYTQLRPSIINSFRCYETTAYNSIPSWSSGECHMCNRQSFAHIYPCIRLHLKIKIKAAMTDNNVTAKITSQIISICRSEIFMVMIYIDSCLPICSLVDR
jgi:hypothetical protein